MEVVIMRIVANAINAALVLVALTIGPVQAGPVNDFERTLAAAYADYRQALFLTNQKNAEGTMRAIGSFETKWASLMSTYAKAPPPQYADDPEFAGVLTRVAETNQQAKKAAADGKLAESHEVLEAIRDQLGGLRLRNGMTTFSDRMNAYHEKMEHMVGKTYDGFSAAGLGDLREDAAVLAHMADDMKRNPSPEAGAADYAPLMKSLIDSVVAVQTAARGGDAAGAKAAVTRLKPAYSRLFVKFG
jgi:hypothetical protein